MGVWALTSPTDRGGQLAAPRPGGRRRVRVHAQGPADHPHRLALSGPRAARPHRRDRRPAPSATPTRWPALRARRRRPGARAGRALPRRARARGLRHRAGRADGSAPIPARFLPTAYRDLDELDGFLEHLAGEVYDRGYSALAAAAARRRRAARAPGAARRARAAGHHAYLGGLLEHTVAVATLAHETCQLHPRLNSDLLITAAIVHDLGRTREFTYGAEIGHHRRGPAARPPGHRRADAHRARRRRARR